MPGGQPSLPSSEPSRRIDPSHEAESPSYYWTWRLLSAGFRVQECAEIRRLSVEEILADAADAVENNLQLDLRWIFSTEELAEIYDELGAIESQAANHRPSKCPELTPRQRLLRVCRRADAGKKSPF